MREKQVFAVLGERNYEIQYSQRNEIELLKKGKLRKVYISSSSSSSSLDAVDVFRAHFDAEEMELQGIVLCAVSESGENGIGNKGSIGLWYFFHNWWM